MPINPARFAAIACVFLSACGGGSGSADTSGTDPATVPAPSVSPAPVPDLIDTPASSTPGPDTPPAVPGTTGVVDPLFEQQWHLKNTGQLAANGTRAAAGLDIHVEPVWASCNGNGSANCKGEGVTIAVVDNGLEIAHEDLLQNMSSSLRHRVYSTSAPPADGNPTLPQAEGMQSHGTRVAGIIAARDNNGLGGRGVAPRASLVGYGLLRAQTTSNTIDAMTYQASAIAVSSNSWGPVDGTGQLIASSSLWRDAIDHGLSTGRNGLGTVYVWAAGNGGAATNQDLSNYDGYANYRGVMAVGAVNAEGKKASYSEYGSNLWVSAPGGEPCQHGLAITTTDTSGAAGTNTGSTPGELPDPDYTQCSNGTSFAAPMVSGVVALMLQANPSLSWRDVRSILARTARHNDRGDSRWRANAANRMYNDGYGFGLVDATAAVNAARGWTSLPAQRAHSSETQAVNADIPDDSTEGVSSSITISNSGISNIEWVDVTVSAPQHGRSGDLLIVLISPGGTQSMLALPHTCAGVCTPYQSWRFGVARHLEESADGTWRIVVQDRAAGATGPLQSWQMTVYGHE